MTRNRSRTGPLSTGTVVTNSGIPCAYHNWNHSWYRYKESCKDETFIGDGHPFETSRIEWSGIPAEAMGNGCGADFVKKVINFVPQSLRQLPIDTSWHVPALGRPSNGELAAKLLAETSPSRPVVDLPVAIGELHELPGLIRGYGDGFLKAYARGHLIYHFGIRPMISDLSSLLDFQDEFAKRMRELNALKEGTLRRKRALFRGFNSNTGSATINSGSSNGGTITASIVNHTTEEVWGFVRWKPSQGFPKTDDALRRAARRAVLGLTVDFSTAWNLIPWSWLADWCSSTGDYLMANRNIIPCTPTGLCIMSRRHSRIVYTKSGGNFTDGRTMLTPLGPWYVDLVTKSRSPATATLDAHLPILNRRQMSILRAIAISKYRR